MSTGAISRIAEYAFKPDTTFADPIFRLPNAHGIARYVSQAFLRVVFDHNLSGIGFVQVWDDGPVVLPARVPLPKDIGNGLETLEYAGPLRRAALLDYAPPPGWVSVTYDELRAKIRARANL
jgi:hypothetical protein